MSKLTAEEQRIALAARLDRIDEKIDRMADAVIALARAEEKIITHCLNNLAKFKIPSEIAFVSELPRNATGKVLKRTLKEISSKNV